MSEIVVPPTRDITPLHLLQIALEKESNIDVIERIARLQKDEREYQETIDFNAALSRCQSQMTRISADCTNPQTRSKYASYPALDRVLRPIYSAEGFSLSFGEDAASTADVLVVLGFLSRGGHTRVYRKTMPVDPKGPKGNDVMTKTHAAGSADSYAKRYLLKDIFNVAVGEDDDDGNGETPEHARIVAESVDAILKASNHDSLQSAFSVAFGVAELQRDREAMAVYTQARDNRKAELDTEEEKAWTKQFAANETIADFNKYVVPKMKTDGGRYKMAAAAEAKRRGWKADKATGAFVEAA